MTPLTSVLLPAILATLQAPVNPRVQIARPHIVGPQVLIAQIPGFQGTWFGDGTDSATRRIVRVRGLHVRVSEACLPSSDGSCDYDAEAVPYSLRATSGSKQPVSAVAVEYGDTLWHQLLILREQEGGRLDAFVYTRFSESASRVNTYEHQLLGRGVQMRPPPVFIVAPPMPQFPWPPPPPTASLRLPDRLVAAPKHGSLGAVFDRLRDALGRVDVGWWSVYAIDADGFAVVTKMEAIDADGRPKAGTERWSGPNDQLPPHFSGIGDYLKALFSARPGFYRIIVFAVTQRPSQSAGEAISADSAARLLRGGSDQLPQWLRDVPLGPDGRCIALIYEFERRTESDTALLVTTTGVGARQHLTMAGLWTAQQLRK